MTQKQFDFRWDVLDIIVGGKSTIDTQQAFQVNHRDDATRFVASYGFDLDNPIENAECLGHFHEALNFIRKSFLQPENPEGLRLEIPRKLLELTDVRDLFLMACYAYANQEKDTAGTALRNWACSVLKVMHTLAHIDQDLRSMYFGQVQQQILDRFYRVIQRDPEGNLYLGEGPDDALKVPLVRFETKPKKSRDSILVKLLHKPENVAEDIFDRVGIRFVTHTTLDALRVIKYLKDKMIVMPPNLKPSRSRNTLVALDDFRAQLGDSLARFESGQISGAQLREEAEAAARPPSVNPENPHSSEFYRSIQFTCRQLIKMKNPLYGEIRELRALGKSLTADEMASVGASANLSRIAQHIERMDLRHLQKESRFFYPYEVQVVDIRSHEDNEKGRSAHSEYKKAQLQTALKRVMGALADAARQ